MGMDHVPIAACAIFRSLNIFSQVSYAMHGIGDDADGKRTALMG